MLSEGKGAILCLIRSDFILYINLHSANYSCITMLEVSKLEFNPRDLLQITARSFGMLNKNCCNVGGIDISLVQSHILYEVDRLHQPSIQQIADRLGMDITTFSRQVQTLMNKKLVTKSALPEDRRVYILALTMEGKFVAGSINSMMEHYLNEVFGSMNDFERDTVLRSLKLLNDRMNQLKSCCSTSE